MPISRYALVTYVRNPVGEFIEELRRELHPTAVHPAAHLTILPPRELAGTEAGALGAVFGLAAGSGGGVDVRPRSGR